MPNSDLKAEVIDLIAHERGLARAKLRLADRLVQDLGMDGDDAVDFFKGVQERFGTDLTNLHERWSEHSGAEGVSWRWGLVIIPAAVIGGIVAGVAGLSVFWGLAVAAGMLAAWVWVMRRWGPPDRLAPVTVGEAVAAVEAGAWPGRPPA